MFLELCDSKPDPLVVTTFKEQVQTCLIMSLSFESIFRYECTHRVHLNGVQISSDHVHSGQKDLSELRDGKSICQNDLLDEF